MFTQRNNLRMFAPVEAAAGSGSAPAPSAPPPVQTPPATPEAKTPPWGDDPSKYDPEKAWELIQKLRAEKAPDTAALEKQLKDMEAASEAQREALAKALGVQKAEVSDADKLTARLDKLAEQFEATQRENALLLAMGEHQIPVEHRALLTGEGTVEERAKALGELLATTKTPPPGFQPSGAAGINNGQSPTLAEQISSAEKDLAGKTPGTPEFKTASARVFALKAQQVAAQKA